MKEKKNISSAQAAVLIVLRPEITQEQVSVVKHLLHWLSRRKAAVYFLPQEEHRLAQLYGSQFSHLPIAGFSALSTVVKKLDLVISLGGDGTLLGLCRELSRSIPILGVNWGRLGFLTEFNASSLYEGLEKFFRKDYTLLKKPLYKVVLKQQAPHQVAGQRAARSLVFEASFMNDVVIGRKNISRLFRLRVECDGEHFYEVAGDGLIVSTPLGSTAYSLAAGGPIVHPELKAFVLTPICPHGLIHRPVVIPGDKTISITLSKDEQEVNVTIDGQVSHSFAGRDILEVSLQKTRSVLFIKNEEKTYFQTLRNKFVDHVKQNT